MRLAFDPQDVSFNRANAIYLAHASDIAYLRRPIEAVRQRLGLNAVAFCDKVSRTRGFVGVCDTHAVVAFRGSDPLTLANWLTDAVVRLVAHAEYEGRVHLGFSAVLRRSWKMVEAALQQADGKPLFVTGHSLGGADRVPTGQDGPRPCGNLHLRLAARGRCHLLRRIRPADISNRQSARSRA